MRKVKYVYYLMCIIILFYGIVTSEIELELSDISVLGDESGEIDGPLNFWGNQIVCDGDGDLHLFVLDKIPDEHSLSHACWDYETSSWSDIDVLRDDLPAVYGCRMVSCDFNEVKGEQVLAVSYYWSARGAIQSPIFPINVGIKEGGEWNWNFDEDLYPYIPEPVRLGGHGYNPEISINESGQIFGVCWYGFGKFPFTHPTEHRFRNLKNFHAKSKFIGGALTSIYDEEPDYVRVNGLNTYYSGGYGHSVCLDSDGVAHVLYMGTEHTVPWLSRSRGIQYVTYDISSKQIYRELYNGVFYVCGDQPEMTIDDDDCLHATINGGHLYYYSRSKKSRNWIRSEEGLPVFVEVDWNTGLIDTYTSSGFLKNIWITVFTYRQLTGTTTNELGLDIWKKGDKIPSESDPMGQPYVIFDQDDIDDLINSGIPIDPDNWGIMFVYRKDNCGYSVKPKMIVDKASHGDNSFNVHVIWQLWWEEMSEDYMDYLYHRVITVNY